MEKTKILTKLDFKTLKYCNLFLMKYQKKTKIWFGVTAALALAVAIYDIIELKQYIFTAFGVFFVLYSAYQMKTIEKKLDSQLSRFFTGRPVITQTVEVDNEKVTVVRSIDPENPTVYDWSFVNEICEMPQYYMLMIGKGSPVIIDRDEEAILEGSKHDLDAIIAEKSTLKPYKSTTEDIVKTPITFVHQDIPTEDVVDVESVVEDVEVEEVEDDNLETIITDNEEVSTKKTNSEDEFH